jgi:hypothetical protein
MTEKFLHCVWQNNYFDHTDLKTVEGMRLKIINPGILNTNSGPDFLNAQIYLDDILWAGHIEVHKKASDWYVHGHEKDPAYDNVILHIVAEDDMPVYNSNNQQIPTLVISKLIPKGIIKKYNQLIKDKSILPCQNDIHKVDPFILNNFKSRLFIERLEDKFIDIQNLLVETKQNWHQVFYQTLLKYMGGTVNKDAFELLGRFLPYNILIKHRDNLLQLEALLFGVAGLLNDKNDEYAKSLNKEYLFLKEKYQLEELPPKMIKFHRLRPSGFPTIRLAQIAQLFYLNEHLIFKIIDIEKVDEILKIFKVSASDYWNTHYNFEKKSKFLKKTLGKNTINSLIINVIAPFKFAYSKFKGLVNFEKIMSLLEVIPAEKNHIIDVFNKLNINVNNALESQAFIQLYNNYCIPKKCLNCDIGNAIIKMEL